MDIPKEVCVRAKVNPRKTKRPIIKKWCYSPERSDSDNSDNADTDSDNDSEDTTLNPLEESVDIDSAEETAPPRRG